MTSLLITHNGFARYSVHVDSQAGKIEGKMCRPKRPLLDSASCLRPSLLCSPFVTACFTSSPHDPASSSSASASPCPFAEPLSAAGHRRKAVQYLTVRWRFDVISAETTCCLPC